MLLNEIYNNYDEFSSNEYDGLMNIIANGEQEITQGITDIIKIVDDIDNVERVP